MKIKQLSTALFILIAITVTVYVSFFNDTPTDSQNTAAENPNVGFEAPNFTLDSHNKNKTYTLDEMNQPLLINFWASWCAPCHEEAPDLAEAYEKHGDQVEFLAINLTDQDQKKGIDDFIKEYTIEFPVLLDLDGKVGNDYQVLAIPTTLFVNKDGVVEHKVQGLVNHDTLEKHIKQLLKQNE